MDEQTETTETCRELATQIRSDLQDFVISFEGMIGDPTEKSAEVKMDPDGSLLELEMLLRDARGLCAVLRMKVNEVYNRI